MSTDSVGNILRALYNSVLEAQRLTEEEHIRQLRRYTFNPDDPDVEPGREGAPRTFPIRVPDPTGGEGGERTVEVPLIALMPPSSLKIKDLSVSFRARLLGFDNAPNTVESRPLVPSDPEYHSGPLQAAVGDAVVADDSGNVAEFTVTFVANDPPEAFARLTDRLTQGAFP